MGRAKDDVGVARLHVLGVHVEKFLVRASIDVLPTRERHQTARVAVLRCNDVTARQTHEHQHARLRFALDACAEIRHERLVFRHQRLRLIAAVELRPHGGDARVHAINAAQIQEHARHSDARILRAQVVDQGVRADHAAGMQRFERLQVGRHGASHLRQLGIALGQVARGVAHAHQFQVELVADGRHRRRRRHQALLLGAIGVAVRVLVDAAGQREGRRRQCGDGQPSRESTARERAARRKSPGVASRRLARQRRAGRRKGRCHGSPRCLPCPAHVRRGSFAGVVCAAHQAIRPSTSQPRPPQRLLAPAWRAWA